MSTRHSQPRKHRSRPFPIAIAAILDISSILAFAAQGRGEHELAVSVTGVWATAWPFLSGLLVGWLIAQAHRRPTAVVRTGFIIWPSAIVVGMTLRYFFGDGGAAPAFVAVASAMLLVTLVGWRVVWALISMAVHRSRPLRSQ